MTGLPFADPTATSRPPPLASAAILIRAVAALASARWPVNPARGPASRRKGCLAGAGAAALALEPGTAEPAATTSPPGPGTAPVRLPAAAARSSATRRQVWPVPVTNAMLAVRPCPAGPVAASTAPLPLPLTVPGCTGPPCGPVSTLANRQVVASADRKAIAAG
jgi:hypothetical protein